MEVLFGYAKEKIAVNIPDQNYMGTLVPNHVELDLTGEEEVVRSLQNPIGTPRLKDMVKKGQKIAIITSDITRPMPSYKVIPHVLDELHEAGIPNEDITVVFALGSHGGHSEERMRHMVGDKVFETVRCIDSDMNDTKHLGTTSRGTPVDIFTPVAEADFKICMGNIEYHYFAGYSGGAKAIMPGVSTRDAIQNNHSAMVRPEACAGRLEGNPVREDIEESGAILGIDFIVNVVLNLVSAGGFPKDINMYQAQKALDNAKHAIKDGGIIIWIAECSEGLGEKHFEDWMTGHEKSSDMIDHIKRDFVLGGHKAAAIMMVLQKARIILVSGLEPDFVKSVFLEPCDSIEKALNIALNDLGPDAKVLAMPYGGSTLPRIKN